jgi:hypothetical protein
MSDVKNDIPVDRLASVYIKIRDKKAEMKAAFDEEYNALSKKQDVIKNALLEYCKENNFNSVKTPAGTISRKVKSVYWTSDWESMGKFIIEHNVPEFFQKSLNQTNVKQFMEDNPDLTPPGLNTNSEYVISVTKPRRKV